MKVRLLTALAFAALGFSFQAEAQQRITVTVYSGVWGASQQECILDPFTKATGITAVPEPGISTVTVTKLKQSAPNPTIDVAWVDGGVSELGYAEGVFDVIDTAKVPNLSGLEPRAAIKSPDGKVFALNTGYYGFGIFYNTKEIKEAPTSWWDLWDPKYANRVMSPAPAQAPFPGYFLHLNKLLGGSPSNFKPGIDKFKTLKVASYYTATGAIQSAIQSGEVLLGAFYVNATWGLADKDMPIAAVSPKEGATTGDIRVHIAKGTKNLENAYKFINFAVSPDALNCLAEKLYVGPPLKTPTLPQKIADRMPWGKGGNVSQLVIPDWNEVNNRKAELLDTWNREVVK